MTVLDWFKDNYHVICLTMLLFLCLAATTMATTVIDGVCGTYDGNDTEYSVRGTFTFNGDCLIFSGHDNNISISNGLGGVSVKFYGNASGSAIIFSGSNNSITFPYSGALINNTSYGIRFSSLYGAGTNQSINSGTLRIENVSTAGLYFTSANGGNNAFFSSAEIIGPISYGVYFTASNNNVVSGLSTDAIRINGSTNAVANGAGAYNNTVRFVRATSQTRGVYYTGGANLTLTNLTILNSSNYGISLSNNTATITNCTIMYTVNSDFLNPQQAVDGGGNFYTKWGQTVLPYLDRSPIVSHIRNCSYGEDGVTFNGNNISFVLDNNISFAAYATYDCLRFTGSGNIFNGQWNDVTTYWNPGSGSTTLIPINVTTGDTNLFENFTIGFQPQYTCNLFMPDPECYPWAYAGMHFRSTSTGNTVRAFKIKSSDTPFDDHGINVTNPSHGIRSLNNGDGINITAGSIQCNNNASSYAVSTAANAVINFTNLYAFGACTNKLNLNAGGTYTDSGYNWWTSCTGSCAWYDLDPTTIEIASYDTFTTSANPTTNYDTATYAPDTISYKRIFLKYGNISLYPPTRIFFNATQYIYLQTKGSGKNIKAYYTDFVWNSSNLTEATLPNSGNFTYCDQEVKDIYLGWVGYDACINNTKFTSYFGSAIQVSITNVNSTDDFSTMATNYSLTGNASNPYMNSTWRYTFRHAGVDYYYVDENSSVHGLTTGLSLENASLCSYFMPTRGSANLTIRNLFTGAVIPSYTSPWLTTNAGAWYVFNCSNVTFYLMDFVQPLFTSSTNGTCPPNYTKFATMFYMDETTSTNTTGNSTINFSGIDYESGNNFSGSISATNSGSYVLCKSTEFATDFNATFNITYSNANSGIRDYYLTADESTDTTVLLWLIDKSYLSAITFTTINQFAQPLPNRLQHYMRYFPGNGTYQLVAMGTTDSNGQTLVNLYTNGSTFYKIISFMPGSNSSIEKTFNAEAVFCLMGQACEHTLIISENQTLPEYWTTFYGQVQGNCTYNNGTKTITCIYADSSGTSHEFDLWAWRLNYSDKVAVCNTSSTGASGTLLCTINDTNTSGRVYYWIFQRHSDVTPITGGILDFLTQPWGGELMLAFIIIVTAGMLGMINPWLAVITGTIGLVMAALIGVVSIPVMAISEIVVVAIILAWRLGRR